MDRHGSMRKMTKLEKNSPKLELPNKNCIYDKSVCRTT